jgi:hypothetical protein
MLNLYLYSLLIYLLISLFNSILFIIIIIIMQYQQQLLLLLLLLLLSSLLGLFVLFLQVKSKAL